MRESLQPLFLTTGALVWVIVAGFIAVCVLGLVIDYGWRSLRWLFGLPRGTSIWDEPVKASTPALPDEHADSSPEVIEPTDCTRLQSMGWAAGEVPQALPTAKEPQ